MLTIDGSAGEGGGQILRTSLALALITGQPFRIERIRARRPRPGLMRQHLTAVRAAAQIGAAEVSGDALGSVELTFRPRQVRGGAYSFDVGTAGSTTLVLQTVLPALLLASGPSELSLSGGTHNPHAPPFDFLRRVFLPIVGRMGPVVEARLERAGFYPAGGGRCTFKITPAERLTPLTLLERGPVRRVRASAKLARLPEHIAERELAVVRQRLGDQPLELAVELIPDARGPGNVVMVEIESAQLAELFTAFGERGVRAEAVGARVAEAARSYLAADVPVGPHLADQLLLPWALAGSGSFRTQPLTLHARTNLDVIQAFLGERLKTRELADGSVLLESGT